MPAAAASQTVPRRAPDRPRPELRLVPPPPPRTLRPHVPGAHAVVTFAAGLLIGALLATLATIAAGGGLADAPLWVAAAAAAVGAGGLARCRALAVRRRRAPVRAR